MWRPDHDAHVLAWFAAWLATAALPPAPFLVNRATLVEDPQLYRDYLTAALEQERGRVVRGGSGSCVVRTALLTRLRLLRKLERNWWRLTEG